MPEYSFDAQKELLSISRYARREYAAGTDKMEIVSSVWRSYRIGMLVREKVLDYSMVFHCMERSFQAVDSKRAKRKAS